MFNTPELSQIGLTKNQFARDLQNVQQERNRVGNANDLTQLYSTQIKTPVTCMYTLFMVHNIVPHPLLRFTFDVIYKGHQLSLASWKPHK